MGVAFAGGLSKNGSWSDPDAVVPVVKVSRFLEVQPQTSTDALFSTLLHTARPEAASTPHPSWVVVCVRCVAGVVSVDFKSDGL